MQTIFGSVTQSSSPRTSTEANGTFLSLLVASVLIKVADFTPKIGWRWRENYFGSSQHRLTV